MKFDSSFFPLSLLSSFEIFSSQFFIRIFFLLYNKIIRLQKLNIRSESNPEMNVENSKLHHVSELKFTCNKTLLSRISSKFDSSFLSILGNFIIFTYHDFLLED